MHGYVLTDAAEADLRGIIRYTSARWGQAQVRRYIADLEQGIAHLAGECTFKDLSTLYPALRMSHCMHHYVFCLPREQAPSLIVAILHERMDLMVRLAGRL
ncbi:plasmid stabilization system protein ParE [Xanthomonas arboricola]|uniref:type II toxin-antitoxin system RelE/ParE family toxin n=1 Tax=Xanthomonas euroxanthea TaxID=2259622 RepID=UPI00141B349B|nr:type II toxin-antitoxin system RelE/ParE family toxin [Xanthomonas euroxanthea]NIK40949.1 plasmid stabilization system protein ParE [Xanthomonas euroxanthea]NJC37026.1 plasmid stabilization system protein ParE [Xanthomonas euroxanthea]